MLSGVWEFSIWKKRQEIDMSRISVFQLIHLTRARVAFYIHGNKKSVFLPDSSHFWIIKEGYETNMLFGIYMPLYLQLEMDRANLNSGSLGLIT